MQDTCYCSFCGINLVDGDSAYGFTSGIISSEYCGFLIGEEEWDIYCSACRTTIDRMIADYKLAEKKLSPLACNTVIGNVTL